ncbi:hypothetical protein AAFC00_001710 [Neodothiora populina]|uniref:Copper acquisition factor BIM1-like domain-containing protein n=1 Tax=Neodothiora populina TaxID=2781224 RepID=A0ABR3PPW6_9PEZI
MLFLLCLSLALNLGVVSAHTVITYPGWRGNNLITNGTLPEHDPSALGENYVDGSYTFPYGMQWMYPCGGMPTSTNRSLWPVTGGALALQPGWFPGHQEAKFYVNIGINGPGEAAPPNMSHNVVPAFSIRGPINQQYDGTICLPQVPLVPNVTFSIGDNLTIQVIELAQHGAAIYNCADVTLADPADVPAVNSSNCFNSSDIGFQLVFTTTSLSAAVPQVTLPTLGWTLTCMLAILFAAVSW